VPVDPSDLYAGYQRASRIAPVDRSVIETALTPYKLTLSGLRGKSDADLRRMAAAAVLARYRARKAAPAPEAPGASTDPGAGLGPSFRSGDTGLVGPWKP
jgi:hypothetical protein